VKIDYPDMKKSLIPLIQLMFVLAAFMACKTDAAAPAENPGIVEEQEEEEGSAADSTTASRIIVRIGSQQFSATLTGNATANAFKARLPLTISMAELNGNEKYYHFSSDLPSNPASPGGIAAGDLMLYNANSLVLFYEAFNTSYRYTRIGKIDNVSGLVAALGSGNVTVSFTLE
jgi:hypothetical protein